MAKNVPGTIYLLHFETPMGSDKHSASHYLGWTSNLAERIQAHRDGKGSFITAAAAKKGIRTYLTWTKSGTRTEERKLHKKRQHARLCPECRDKFLEKKKEQERVRREKKRGKESADLHDMAVSARPGHGVRDQGHVAHQGRGDEGSPPAGCVPPH